MGDRPCTRLKRRGQRSKGRSGVELRTAICLWQLAESWRGPCYATRWLLAGDGVIRPDARTGGPIRTPDESDLSRKALEKLLSKEPFWVLASLKNALASPCSPANVTKNWAALTTKSVTSL